MSGQLHVKISPSPDAIASEQAENIRHTLFQDAFGLTIGCALTAVGIIFMKDAGIATGGVAGVALLSSYISPLPVSVLYTLINLPFFCFAFMVMGRNFAVRSIIASVVIMCIGLLAPKVIAIDSIDPVFAALAGGMLIGVGILGLARHGAGSGGTGIMSLYLQKKAGINAGKTLFTFDIIILGASMLVLQPMQVLLSVLSAAVISAVMFSFHKAEIYRAQ